MLHTVSYAGKILFEPENITKKHESQSDWKRVAMIIFDGDIEEYYCWFLKKRFNLKLNNTLRGSHVTFINDRITEFNNGMSTVEECELLWKKLKEKWDGKEISVTFNLRPFTDVNYQFVSNPESITDNFRWWLVVDHNFRDEIQSIRKEIGLGKPYYGLHMTIGNLTQNYKLDNGGKLIRDENGNKISIFNLELEQAKYIQKLHELGFVEINKDYGENY